MIDLSTLEVKERIVKDMWITLEGRKLNVEHLLDLLEEISSGPIEVDRQLGELLVKFGVLKSIGSRRWMTGAEVGPEFYTFQGELAKLYHQASADGIL